MNAIWIQILSYICMMCLRIESLFISWWSTARVIPFIKLSMPIKIMVVNQSTQWLYLIRKSNSKTSFENYSILWRQCMSRVSSTGIWNLKISWSIKRRIVTILSSESLISGYLHSSTQLHLLKGTTTSFSLLSELLIT